MACSCARRFRYDLGGCTRYDWRIDCRPATNIDRRDVVGQSRVTAHRAEKNALAFAIGFVNMPTLRASAARVAGVNQHHWYTGPLGFVGDKRPQLSELELFKAGILEDARLLGDGFDFQIQINARFILARSKEYDYRMAESN